MDINQRLFNTALVQMLLEFDMKYCATWIFNLVW